MVSSKETTPAAYLASLPPERRAVIEAVRTVIRKRLPTGYVETMNWGMLSYEIPLSTYPDTYNKQPLMYLALAAQKNNYALYTTNVRSNPALLARLTAAYKAAGRKLDMGGGCIRFKSLDELPMDVIGEIVAATPVAQRIAESEAGRSAKSAAKKSGAKVGVKPAAPAKKAARAKKAAPAKKGAAAKKAAPAKKSAARPPASTAGTARRAR